MLLDGLNNDKKGWNKEKKNRATFIDRVNEERGTSFALSIKTSAAWKIIEMEIYFLLLIAIGECNCTFPWPSAHQSLMGKSMKYLFGLISGREKAVERSVLVLRKSSIPLVAWLRSFSRFCLKTLKIMNFTNSSSSSISYISKNYAVQACVRDQQRERDGVSGKWDESEKNPEIPVLMLDVEDVLSWKCFCFFVNLYYAVSGMRNWI